jgi:hypothetical protein
MPVPAAKFEEAFGLSWKDALAAGSVYNALDAVSYSKEIILKRYSAVHLFPILKRSKCLFLN